MRSAKSSSDLFDPYDNLIQLHKARLAGFQKYAEELLAEPTSNESSYLFSWQWNDDCSPKPRTRSMPRPRTRRIHSSTRFRSRQAFP